MAAVPSHARAVVIGAGIVGNSLVYQLALHGWKDIVLLDKGPLPNPGGSTGHASNFIFLVDHSKEMTDLTLESHVRTDLKMNDRPIITPVTMAMTSSTQFLSSQSIRPPVTP